MSIVELDGTWMVVFACQPSDTLPWMIGIFGSEYDVSFTTHVTMPVWLIVKAYVWSAGPEGGLVGAKGESS